MFESEIKVMDVLWDHGDMKATEVCSILNKKHGWHPNTTYTIIKKCIHKGYLKRSNPGFWCSVEVTREETQKKEAARLIKQFFKGSVQSFLISFLSVEEELSLQDLQALQALIDQKILNKQKE